MKMRKAHAQEHFVPRAVLLGPRLEAAEPVRGARDEHGGVCAGERAVLVFFL